MRIILEIVQEMVLVLLIVEVLAAVMALPLWLLINHFDRHLLWHFFSGTYWEAWIFTSILVIGIVVVTWVADISKGVNL